MKRGARHVTHPVGTRHHRVELPDTARIRMKPCNSPPCGFRNKRGAGHLWISLHTYSEIAGLTGTRAGYPIRRRRRIEWSEPAWISTKNNRRSDMKTPITWILAGALSLGCALMAQAGETSGAAEKAVAALEQKWAQAQGENTTE